MNKLIFLGTVIREPRYSDAKKPVLSFTLLSERHNAGKTFKSFLDCAVFDAKAQAFKDIIKEGSIVLVEGEAGSETYTGRDSKPKSKLKCFPFSVEILAFNPSGVSPSSIAEPGTTPEPSNNPDGDDVPF